jgi:chromosome segregation protein
MRLEKVVLDGFKSFADKTEFVFSAAVTGIVGPNGCGKSNVVDAVKWVFGEQSAKSLRSGRMTDIIFSGSASRKPAGCAEVSLFLANTAGTESGRLPIDADEVQITRRIYQSGDSEYRINNKLCRLKDVRELFMDTGVGVRAYSIIEQGQVERLLSASSVERRVIFEEAAGISKYKAHKEEALRKLERTEQNLLRLADIVSEDASRLRSVKLAAGKARSYVQYTQRLKELQVNYSLAEFDKIFKTAAQKKAALDESEKNFAVSAAEVARHDALLGEIGQQIIDTENSINHTDNSLVAVQSKIEQQMQRIEFLRTRIKELEQRKAAAVARAQQLAEQKSEFTIDLEKYQAQQQENEKSFEQCNLDIERTSREIAEINAQCSSLEAELEDEKSGIIDIVRHTAQLHNELQSISVYRTNLSSQKDRLAGRAQVAGAELEKLLTDKAQCDARLNDIETVIADLTKNLDAKRKESDTCVGRVEADKKRLANSKEARSALASELAVLTDMENRREGVKAGAKRILENQSQFDYVEGILADIITAHIDYAAAVEAALEDKTDAVVIASTEKLLAGKDAVDKLRVHFISADKIGPFVNTDDLSTLSGVKGRLVEFVNYQPKHASLVWALLGKTLIVDSIDKFGQLSETLGPDYKFVTLKGEFASGDGFIKLGPLGRAAGLISRKSRLRQLQDTITNITNEIDTLQNQIDESIRTGDHLTKLCKDLRTAVYEANTEKTQINSKLAALEESIKRLSEEQPLITGEIDQLEKQIAQSVQKEYESKQKLQELETVNNQRNARISQLQGDYSNLKGSQQSLTEKLTDLKVSLGQISEHRQSLIQTIQSLQTQLAANAGAVAAAESEIKSCADQASAAQTDILVSESAVSELFSEKDLKQQSSSQLHSQIEGLLAEQKSNEQTLRDKRAGQSQIEQQINELKIELGQLDVRQQDLTARVRDELQLDLLQSYQNYQDTAVDWEKVREEIAELRGKIERLGNVNLDAIQEQQDLEQRHTFLSTQVEDLNSSKGQLQQLINRLNKVSREKFLETFELVRGHFQQIFRKLFGGGKADIVLEQAPDMDVLDAGIEIVARPPGKETRSISLLSGGEKAMTAIALLFSVFKAKPSPFCFLDEVDAALDEANNERFDAIVREFQKESQFIIITHSKRTMSVTDMLYGITMQTQGISKRISVNFDHYSSEPAAA